MPIDYLKKKIPARMRGDMFYHALEDEEEKELSKILVEIDDDSKQKEIQAKHLPEWLGLALRQEGEEMVGNPPRSDGEFDPRARAYMRRVRTPDGAEAMLVVGCAVNCKWTIDPRGHWEEVEEGLIR